MGDVPAIHDVIEHNKTGLITEQDNSHLLAENIIVLLQSPEKRILLVENGRKHVQKNFSWDKSVLKYNNIIDNLISKPVR